MSNSSLSKKDFIKNHYSKGRDGYKIKRIVIHHMASTMTPKQCRDMFNSGSREVSSHYVLKDNTIIQCVDEKNTAWTNGNWISNCESVTIEVSNSKIGGTYPISEKSLNTLIKLVADIAKRNKLGKLVPKGNLQWHCLIANTACPGKYLISKMDYICEEANKINGYTKTTGKLYTGTFPKLPVRGYFKRGDKGTQVKYLQKFLNWAVGSKLVEDGVIGSLTIQAVEKFEKKVSIDVDGLFGKNCLKKAKEFRK